MARALSHCGALIFSKGRMPTRNGSLEQPVGLRQFQASRDRSVPGTDTTQPPHRPLNQARTARSRFATTTVTEYPLALAASGGALERRRGVQAPEEDFQRQSRRLEVGPEQFQVGARLAQAGD